MYQSDIPLSAAQGAHRGTSFVPEKRGEQEREEYAQTLTSDHEVLLRLADTDEKRELLKEEFARYRAGYRSHYLSYLGARSRCMSSMITGPSNFPTRRNQKRNATADRRGSDLTEFRERALKAIRRKLCPEKAPVMSGDADAVERLTAKVEKAEKWQKLMKDTNAAIRKHKKEGRDAQVAALVTLGLSEEVAGKLLEPDFAGRIGFPSYEMTNNNANIRRMKGRIPSIERARSTPDSVTEGAAARIEDCPGDNRVRLFFPGKPDVEVRTKLKRCGFRWTPSLGCWQAYRNCRSLDLAQEMAHVPKGEERP